MDSKSWVKDSIELTLLFDAMLHVEEPKPSPSGGDTQMWFCIPKWPPRGGGLPFVEPRVRQEAWGSREMLLHVRGSHRRRITIFFS
jgi:hypothetical protein